jgi:hypothetical protein
MKNILYALLWLIFYKPAFKLFIARRQPRPSDAQRWGLAAGGNLTHLNGNNFDYLHNGKSRAMNRHTLRDTWSVDGPQALTEILAWLDGEGHRAAFEQLYKQITALSPAEFAAIQARLPAATQRHYAYVRDNMAAFKHGSLLAWDLGRLINVCRYGYKAGYISEADAWTRIMAAAQRLQREYGSWAELGDNYLLGWKLWQMEAMPDGAAYEAFHIQALHWLKTNPESPWQLPWAMSL